MHSSLIKGSDEKGARARENRRFSQGTVIAVDATGHTVDLDVGETTPSGAAVLLEQVPYSPQSPPHVGDTVLIGYTSTSYASAYVASGRLGNPNSQTTVTVSSPGSASSSVPLDVAASGTAGTSTLFSRGDHAHKGLRSLAASGSAQIFGDAVMAASSSKIALTESGQQIGIDAYADGVGTETFENNNGAIQKDTVSSKTGAQIYLALTGGTATLLPSRGAPPSASLLLVANFTGANLTVAPNSGDVWGGGGANVVLANGTTGIFACVWDAANSRWVDYHLVPA